VSETFLEAGRINFKNGIALGFNPTDFFKTAARWRWPRPILRAARRPARYRDASRAVHLDGGSATFVYAPKLHTPRQINGAAPNWIDPSFDQTNASDRFLLALNLEIEDISPQALVYHESGRTKVGSIFPTPSVRASSPMPSGWAATSPI